MCQTPRRCTCSYAQLGAGYAVSYAATTTVARAHAEMKTFMNAHGSGDVVLVIARSSQHDKSAGRV